MGRPSGREPDDLTDGLHRGPGPDPGGVNGHDDGNGNSRHGDDPETIARAAGDRRTPPT